MWLGMLFWGSWAWRMLLVAVSTLCSRMTMPLSAGAGPVWGVGVVMGMRVYVGWGLRKCDVWFSWCWLYCRVVFLLVGGGGGRA